MGKIPPHRALSNMPSSSCSLSEIQRRIDEVRRFLSVCLSIANAHTVEFYTRDVWSRFVAVKPQEVLSAVSSGSDQQGEPEHQAGVISQESSRTTFGFCNDTHRLVDTRELLQAAKAHSLPGLGVCMSRDELLQALGANREERGRAGAALEPDEFMNSKKSHEVQSMSEVVACLAQHCGVKQVIDLGSGKGYLSSFLSLQYGLRVYGIDSSSTNTHGAQERNRKLKKFSRAYQKHSKVARVRGDASHPPEEELAEEKPQKIGGEDAACGDEAGAASQEDEEALIDSSDVNPAVERCSEPNPEPDELFLSALSVDVMQTTSPRVPPSQLSAEEKERRKRENLERKARNRTDSDASSVFSPLTSYVTAETELRELINELEIQMESLFYRAVLHVILRDHYSSFKSEKRVGNVYSKAKSFVDYVRRALRRLELDESKVGNQNITPYKAKQVLQIVALLISDVVDFVIRLPRLSDSDIQDYHDAYRPRMDEMHAFNMLKVALAPCIEGLILLDRLCYLKEQSPVRMRGLPENHTRLRAPLSPAPKRRGAHTETDSCCSEMLTAPIRTPDPEQPESLSPSADSPGPVPASTMG
ncbi:hypothetical protein L3Q82_000545 [Scortum barcoo]|uniref:Uncharacterized protein n=1 Tax=Scortum barcoo TaxID=214431 RepID=A0ACB8WEN7_9TELE|nr:hypothetical protein L3Q82_000545 [Scortum barcoo]